MKRIIQLQQRVLVREEKTTENYWVCLDGDLIHSEKSLGDAQYDVRTIERTLETIGLDYIFEYVRVYKNEDTNVSSISFFNE